MHINKSTWKLPIVNWEMPSEMKRQLDGWSLHPSLMWIGERGLLFRLDVDSVCEPGEVQFLVKSTSFETFTILLSGDVVDLASGPEHLRSFRWFRTAVFWCIGLLLPVGVVSASSWGVPLFPTTAWATAAAIMPNEPRLERLLNHFSSVNFGSSPMLQSNHSYYCVRNQFEHLN